jgi:hypothetical protein
LPFGYAAVSSKFDRGRQSGGNAGLMENEGGKKLFPHFRTDLAMALLQKREGKM